LAEACVRFVSGYSEAAQRVFHFPEANPMRDMAIPVAAQLLPVLLAVALWLALRGRRDETRSGVTPLRISS
jgi:hypothetical protein